MPSIAEGQSVLEQLVKSGKLVPARVSASIPPAVPVPTPNFPQEPSPYLRTPMPASLVLQPDLQRQFHNQASPQYRIPPQPPAANEAAGAAAASQALAVETTSTPSVTGMTYRGMWASSIKYSKNDVVVYKFSTYIALVSNTNAEPDEGFSLFGGSLTWQMLGENIFSPVLIPFDEAGGTNGITGAFPVDGNTSNTGAGLGTLFVGPLTPNYPNDLALFFGYGNNGLTCLGISPGAGWTGLSGVNSVAYAQQLSSSSPFTAGAAKTTGGNAGILLLFQAYGTLTGNPIVQQSNVLSGTLASGQTLNFPNPVSQTNVLIYVLGSSANVTSSATDADGNIWGFPALQANISGVSLNVGVALNASPGAGAITVTWTGGSATEAYLTAFELPYSQTLFQYHAGNVVQWQDGFFVCAEPTIADPNQQSTFEIGSWFQISSGLGTVRYLTGNYTLVADVNLNGNSDNGNLFVNQTPNTYTVNLPAGVTLPINTVYAFQNVGSGTLILHPYSLLDNSSSDLVLNTGQGVLIFGDGYNYYTMRGSPILSAAGLTNGTTGSGAVVLATSPTFVTGLTTPKAVLTAATPTTTSGQVGLGTTSGFGNGSSGTAVTTTTKGTGTGPTTAQTVVDYLEIDIAGTKYWIPLVQ